MKSLRGIFIGLVIVVILAVVGLVAGVIGINSYIHSEAFRHKMEARAGELLNGTVEIKQIDWNSWTGAKVSGVSTKLTSVNGTLVTEVESIECTCSLRALLKRQLYVRKITVLNPQITVVQQTDSSGNPAQPANPVAKPVEASGTEAPPFGLTVNMAKVVNGKLSIQDATGASKATLDNIAVTAHTAGFFKGEDVTGTLTVATVWLPQNLGITDFSTPFKYNNGVLTASPFQAAAFNGKITGSYTLDPASPSTLQIAATQLDMGQIGAAANPQSPTKLGGLLDLQSTWTGAEKGTLTGQGDIQIANGKLEGVTILHDLSGAFQLKDMADPDLKSVTSHFEVANGTTHFSNLQIVSTVFDMSGSGVVDPKGNLTADMTLTLHPDAFKQIPGFAVPFFTKLPDGSGSIPFKLTGTVANPQSDLTTRTFIQSSKINKTLKKTFDQIFK